MVQINYDIFGRQEVPNFILCNPTGEEIYSLNSASKKQVTRRFNAMSELKMTVPKEVNGTEIPAYAHIKQKRLVLVDDGESGYFIITGVSEDSSGAIPTKEISGISYDFSLVSKKLFAYGGTYPLYDLTDPSSSILGQMIARAPSWSIGEVDSELLGKYRTFDISDGNIYDFLVNDIEQAFGCIILFDNLNKTISAKTLDNVTTPTDVFLSHSNLIKSSHFREISDELSTALYVTGGGDLSINAVNPLGTNVIYDFSYYKTTDWMTSGLISALNAWEALISANQTLYANTLTTVKTKNEELIVLEGELSDLQAELDALNAVLGVRIQEGNLSTADVRADIVVKEAEITSKNTEITNKETEISDLRAILTGINDTLSFENNFTAEQIDELSYYITENTYNNENIVQLDTDTPDIVQEQAQNLYDQAVEVLGRVSQPRYEFDVDAANILSIQAFQDLNSQIELAAIVNMESASGDSIELILLELIYDYTSPGKFGMTFSNRLRLDGSDFVYADLVGLATKTGKKVEFDSLKWSNWGDNYKNDVTTFINSSLDASRNAIINSSNQEILIDENGLRGRKWNSTTEQFEGTEVWLTSNVLGFTEDNWETASLALGNITHNGTPRYGLVGSVIVGDLIAGESLQISNDGNNFILNETGAFLEDASFVLTANDGKNVITLDPTVGIEIASNPSGTPETQFSVDTDGNVVFGGLLSGASGEFSGSITATSGFIGGMAITTHGIDVDTTHYIHNDGEIKWGGLWVKSDGTTTISGEITATAFNGVLDWNNIVNVPIPTSKFNGGTGYSASGITTGTASGSRIYGGVLGGNGLSVNLSGTGFPRIEGNYGVGLYSSNSSIEVGNSYTFLSTPGTLQLEGSPISMYGSLYINGSQGLSKYVYYKDWSDNTKYLRFTNGILTYAS